MATLEVHFEKSVSGKVVVVMEDGSPSYTDNSTTQVDVQLGDVIDPEGDVEYDRDELLEFIINEFGSA